MKYVVSCGDLFKVTEVNYLKVMENIAEGRRPDVPSLGKRIGTVTNVVDFSPGSARALLGRMGKARNLYEGESS